MLSNEEKCPLLALVTSLSSLMAEFTALISLISVTPLNPEHLHAVKAHKEAALCRRGETEGTDQLFIHWIKMCYIGIGIVIGIWNDLYRDMRFWSYRTALLSSFIPSADECENRLLVSNSAHTSFYTVKLKHLSEITITKHFSEWRGTLNLLFSSNILITSAIQSYKV